MCGIFVIGDWSYSYSRWSFTGCEKNEYQNICFLSSFPLQKTGWNDEMCVFVLRLVPFVGLFYERICHHKTTPSTKDRWVETILRTTRAFPTHVDRLEDGMPK